MSKTFTLEDIVIKSYEGSIKCEFYFTPGDPGIHTFSNGDPGYPPSPPEIEPVNIWGEEGVELIEEIDFDNDELIEAILEREDEFNERS